MAEFQQRSGRPHWWAPVSGGAPCLAQASGHLGGEGCEPLAVFSRNPGWAAELRQPQGLPATAGPLSLQAVTWGLIGAFAAMVWNMGWKPSPPSSKDHSFTFLSASSDATAMASAGRLAIVTRS